MSTHANIKKAAILALQRVVGQAYQEGASRESIIAHLTTEGVTDPEPILARVEGMKMIPLLGGVELKKYGGRNKFRALFGLPEAEAPLAQPEPEDFPYTESGDAEHFAQMYAERVRYNHRKSRWLIADDETGLWLPDPVDEMYELAKASMRERQKRALMIDDQSRRKVAMDWALRGENRSRLSNLLALAASVPPLADNGDNWDSDPFLLGCMNGVIDLRYGVVRKASPDERITMRVGVPFDRTKRSELWEDTLDAIFAPVIDSSDSATDLIEAAQARHLEAQANMVSFVQRAFGYTATGDCSEECCFFIYGGGANGKGTLTQTLSHLLNDYHDEMPATTLERSKFGAGIPTDLADLDGKRFVTNAELQEMTVNEARLKAITGRDEITARFLHEDFFSFIPVCKIWIATNNKPKIVGQDDGIWRRIHLIPFLNKFEGPTDNKKLKDILREPEHQQGILTWLVEGSMDWYWNGLRPPQAVIDATKEYREESDVLTPFLEGRCTFGSTVKCVGKDLWAEYQHWCEQSSVDMLWRLGQKAFFHRIASKFQNRKNRLGQSEYFGIGLMGRGEPSRAQEPGF